MSLIPSTHRHRTMTSIASQANSLHPHAAIVSRLLHCHSRLVPFVDWLAEPGSNRLPPQPLRNPRLSAAVQDLVNAISADAADWERRQLANASEWVAATAMLCHSSRTAQHLGMTPRIIASVLLPLYRSLATGRLAECSAAMRLRLAEHIILLAMFEDLGAEFEEWLAPQLLRNMSPIQTIADDLDQDLSSIAELLLDAAAEFDGASGQLNSAGMEILRCHLPAPQANAGKTAEKPEHWAHPQLLWKLAGELIATRSEIILPRPWIDIPVPWPRIQEHWHKLSLQLGSLRLGRVAEDSTESGDEAHESQTVRDLDDLVATVSSAVGEPTSLDRDQPGDLQRDYTRSGTRLDSPAGQQQPHGDLANELGNRELELDARETDARETDCHEGATPPAPLFPNVPQSECLPKVMMAEIGSVNDPAFSNVMRRRLAACRADDRPLCVSIIVVTPDDPNQQNSSAHVVSGLNRWQQALVNWMAEQPHVVDPFAFLTSDDELILCVHDLEKNEMTAQIRSALLHVLAGQNDSNDLQLNKVNVPARFHAGIAATSSPGANLTVEQLVAPALRCLQAAQQQGRTGIKSIEVY